MTPEEKLVIRVSEIRRKLKLKAIKYKGGKCIRCGYDKCVASLHFHHRNPSEKEFRIGTGNIRRFESIRSELDKCDLVCANCHGEIHAEWKSDSIKEGLENLRKNMKKRGYAMISCDICKKIFERSPGNVNLHNFCSLKCYNDGIKLGVHPHISFKASWPDNDILVEMINNTSYVKVGKTLGVSDKAIRKRITKANLLHLINPYFSKSEC